MLLAPHFNVTLVLRKRVVPLAGEVLLKAPGAGGGGGLEEAATTNAALIIPGPQVVVVQVLPDGKGVIFAGFWIMLNT